MPKLHPGSCPQRISSCPRNLQPRKRQGRDVNPGSGSSPHLASRMPCPGGLEEAEHTVGAGVAGSGQDEACELVPFMFPEGCGRQPRSPGCTLRLREVTRGFWESGASPD